MKTGVSSSISLSYFLLSSYSEACIFFKPGKQHDGWFSANDLLQQVNHTINIFEGLTKGWAQGLFLFDNAPSHQKCAGNALSARRMVKGVLLTFSLVLMSHSFQPRRRAGYSIPAVTACAMASFLTVTCSCYTLIKITHPCPAGLRAWKPSFVNGGCGQNGVSLLSALTFIAPLVALIAAAGGSFSHSRILRVKGHSCRSLLKATGTFATSTRSTIAS
jgi:hypothetical protein